VTAAPAPLRRVAMVCSHTSPLAAPGYGRAGGMNVYVRELAAALGWRGISCDVFTCSAASGVTELGPGARVIALPGGYGSDLRGPAAFGASVRRFAEREELCYDVVHSHYWHSGMVGLELARSWRTPLVHTHHTIAAVKNARLSSRDRPEPQVRLAAERAVASAADVLVASTPEEAENVTRLFGVRTARIRVVSPGVNHEVFRPGGADLGRARLRLGDKHVVLAVARLQALKGLDLAVSMLARLRRRIPDAVLVVVGGPSGRAGSSELRDLRSLSKSLGLGEAVRFVGPLGRWALGDAYSAADAVAVCSHVESFNLAALEAAACGTPVVGTAVGCLPSLVRDGSSGFLARSRDPARFADLLAAMLGDEGLLARCRAGAAEAAGSYSWTQTAERIAAAYAGL
jgi:D-inositol-3-phosphate glycosyltransferase